MPLLKKHYLTTGGVKTKQSKLRSDKLIELLELSGQLLTNGYPVQDIMTFTTRLNILTDFQADLVQTALQNGSSLAQSFASIINQPNLIMQLEIADQHGNLAACCQDNAKFLREQQKQFKQLRSLLAYPVLLLLMMTGLMIFIQIVLKPQLQGLLPQEAQSTSNYWPWLLLASIVIVLIVVGLRVPQDKRRYLMLKLPICKNIFRAYYNFLIFTDLAHLLGSGLSLQEILNFMITFNNRSLQSFLANQVATNLQQGQTLTQIINHEPLLPQELELLLTKGDTREFQTVELRLLAKRNFTELDRRLKTLIDQVQPLLFVLIAVIIGALYLQILIPIYDIMKGI